MATGLAWSELRVLRAASQQTGAMSADEAVHSHTHDLDVDVGRSAAQVLRWTVVACALLVVVGAVLLWPNRGGAGEDPLSLGADPLDAHVTEVVEGQCTADPSIVCRTVTFRVTGGYAEGDIGSFELFEGGDFSAGDDIRVIPTTASDGRVIYSFYDYRTFDSAHRSSSCCSSPRSSRSVAGAGVGALRGPGDQPLHHRLVRPALAPRRQQRG